LADYGGKGLFTKELEEALLDNRIDLAVHSLKDMSTRPPEALLISAVLARDDPRDAFVSNSYASFNDLPQYAVVGTCSLRREAFSRLMRPDLQIVPFRGNVETRLKKMASGEADATFLAAIGLERLGLKACIREIMSTDRMLPAVAQAAVALQCRVDDAPVIALTKPLNHEQSYREVIAERAFLRQLDGSCRTPIAALAITENDQIRLEGAVIRPDGSEIFREVMCGAVDDYVRIGADLGEMIRARIGGRLLRDFRIAL
jgi:hydroxymethylbilane synthase